MDDYSQVKHCLLFKLTGKLKANGRRTVCPPFVMPEFRFVRQLGFEFCAYTWMLLRIPQHHR